MKKCARCNNKRRFPERIFGLDKDYFDNCLMTMNQEIREKREASESVRQLPKHVF